MADRGGVTTMDTPEELSDEQCDAIAREVLLMLSRLPVDGEDGWSDRALIRAGYRRASERPTVAPPEVIAALDRMCEPLHESRLSGVTAQEDARCMKIIRDYVLPTYAIALHPDGSTTDMKAYEEGYAAGLNATTERPTLPREPTREMLSAGLIASYGPGIAEYDADDTKECADATILVWRAMYDAAPSGVAETTGKRHAAFDEYGEHKDRP